MRAVVYDRYGPPERLRIEDAPTPSPAPDQVLVRVAATSVNLSDWECLRGSPLYARHIDRTFELDDVSEAPHYVGEGRARGKVVVEVSQDD